MSERDSRRDSAVGPDSRPASGSHIVYVLECADNSLYTGYTTDLERRIGEHNAGDGAKYTRGRTPVELRHHERYETRSAALSREYEIKQLSRAQKERLVGLDDE
ncbi:GIY-YIG nuclease family protein [Natrialba taiwanensis]|uniref:Excinuclease ABC subunit C n=1 Tax=Natrialba taiwanensis DSM 12281 TaxID=1230458 RepID=L9ZND3_9EURY|nr:GIY-YIG nuclease family protein [Natrialba taiwanensis]ELY88010.1 excinuclease ABC subunit C [Natrialba taiwanensis DSM 12281]